MRVYILLLCIMVANSIHPNWRKYNEKQLDPCAKINRIVNHGTHLSVELGISTGGIRRGCIQDLEIGFVPTVDSEMVPGQWPGEGCIGIHGLGLADADNLDNTTSLNCLQLGKYASGSFTEKPIQLSIAFQDPVFTRELNRVNIAHKGDPHPDTVPFTSHTLKVDNQPVLPPPVFTSSNPRPPFGYMAKGIDQPPCSDFGFPGRAAYKPGFFSSLDARLMKKIYTASIYRDIPIAIFPHKTGDIDDTFSIGQTQHDAAFFPTVSTIPPLTPYLTTTLPQFISLVSDLERHAQIAAGYEYPRDWYDERYLAEQNKTEFETYETNVLFTGQQDACAVSIEAVALAIGTLDAVRELTGHQYLADIPNISNRLGKTHAETVALEEHLNTLLKSLSVFVNTDKIDFPVLVSLLDRPEAEDSGLLYESFTESMSLDCSTSGKTSTFCLDNDEWTNLFAINKELDPVDEAVSLIHSLSSGWEPLLCQFDGDCPSITQWTCGGPGNSLERRSIINRQSDNPSCKLWKPIKKHSEDAYVTGVVDSNAGFKVEFTQINIHNREESFLPTKAVVVNQAELLSFFPISPASASSSVTSELHASSSTFPPSSGLLTKDPADQFFVLQCGDIHSNGDFDGLSLTDNPYKHKCSKELFYPFSDEAHRGCTPFNLTSQRNFLFLPMDLLRRGALGTDCAAMNHNTGELGGSFLTMLKEKFPHMNIKNTPELQHIAGYLQSPQLCAAGQTCDRPSPCGMYKDMIKWGGYIGGAVALATKQFEEDRINALPLAEEYECYFGEHEKHDSHLPHTSTEKRFSLYERTRARYEPYNYVNNGGLDAMREELAATNGDIPFEEALALATANRHAFCSASTNYGYPYALEAIMEQHFGDLYHPSVWIRTPHSGHIDKSELHGIHKLRHSRFGENAPVHRFNTPSPFPSPSPYPAPTAIPTPSPLSSPSPAPSPSPFKYFDGPIGSTFRAFFSPGGKGSGHFNAAANYIVNLDIPIPHARPILGGFGAGCISREPAISVMEKYPEVAINALLPLVGTVQNNIRLENEIAAVTDDPAPMITVTVLCLPQQHLSACPDVDVVDCSVMNSCGDTITEGVYVIQKSIPDTIVDSIMGTMLAQKETKPLGESTMSHALANGRMIQMSWPQTQHPKDSFMWTIAFDQMSNIITHSDTPLYLLYLSVGHPNIIIAFAPPLYPLDGIDILRFAPPEHDRYHSGNVCIYDPDVCHTSPSPSPSHPRLYLAPIDCKWNELSCYYHNKTLANCPMLYLLFGITIVTFLCLLAAYYAYQEHQQRMIRDAGSDGTGLQPILPKSKME